MRCKGQAVNFIALPVASLADIDAELAQLFRKAPSARHWRFIVRPAIRRVVLMRNRKL